LVAQAAFLDGALPSFGDYQDAMLTGETRMWHAHLSPYINSGLLDPLALCRAVEQRYREGKVALNGAEGFIRQIIGWREYMRGVYWLAGPDYKDRNYLGATRQLPRFYWSGETDMNCLRQAIGQTWATAYAHHIQRLMVTGNFAMLIGADPHAVHLWYMEVYLDAYEWVTLPNTLGMSQYGDGGLVGTKPMRRAAPISIACPIIARRAATIRASASARTPVRSMRSTGISWTATAASSIPIRRLRNMYRTWERFGDDTKRETLAQAKRTLDWIDAMPAGYGEQDGLTRLD
jgi:deoxyribodipyrimidine photolyase-related protein